MLLGVFRLKIVRFEKFKSWNTHGSIPNMSIGQFKAYFTVLPASYGAKITKIQTPLVRFAHKIITQNTPRGSVFQCLKSMAAENNPLH